ncbi:hypothetical protein PV08_02763 [Exophiala spinifera]|uniref:Xylanolytic transcriptional activator regulatory domain-containing protein n=1 Tax=Exophiala spinifera TaxID=91928 RepID=A0A0D2BIT4_9EURO|nr:uncharacterized protein PV08_02763 [Exophiala spinifera]KIW18475.1 hypothetical protein PV08_02763 [Exophiala spinifera]
MLEESSVVDIGKVLLDCDQVAHPCGSFDAIPGSLAFRMEHSTTFRWRDELSYVLPPPEALDMLSDSYFNSVNWFMLAIDEPKFRARSTRVLANEYVSTADRNFIFLMSLVWGLGAHYLWTSPATSSNMPVPTSLIAEMMKVLDVAYLRITASPTLETVQIAILWGSFHLFNGLPYLGFTIIGSAVRCAQAIGLHRQQRTSSTEESCLVWWAVEIGDKFVPDHASSVC